MDFLMLKAYHSGKQKEIDKMFQDQLIVIEYLPSGPKLYMQKQAGMM